MSTIPSLNPLRSIRTTKTGERLDGFKEGGDCDQPLSPMARLFHEPDCNIYIIGIMGSKTKIQPDAFKAGLAGTFLKNHRFSSLQVMDKENGSMKWISTDVNIEDHVIVPELDPNMDSSEKFVEDYILELSRSNIENTKPLWDLHILNVQTSNAEGICVFRFHHSLGDGISLMNLLLSCTRKISDPKAFPTLAGNKKSGGPRTTSFWQTFVVLWNSFIALIMFISTALFLKDTNTPLKSDLGAAHRPRRFLLKSVSLGDIKLVKAAMNVTINDVVLGAAQAGLHRYLHKRYSSCSIPIPEHIRLRAAFFFNLRATTKFDAFVETIKHGMWGNKIGYVLLPFNIGLKKDPLDYVRNAKIIMERKKASFEPYFTHIFAKLILKLFGTKVFAKLNQKILFNTTIWFSNVPGPEEAISFFGHEVAYLAPSCYGQPTSLMIHVVSYVDKVTFVISADEETIPDPQSLCDEFERSLDLIKTSALATNFVANK